MEKINYDARYGWYTFTPTVGRIKPLKKAPFKTPADALEYALNCLSDERVNVYSVVVNVEMALRWIKDNSK